MSQYNYSVEGDMCVTYKYAYGVALNRAKKNDRTVSITDLHSREIQHVKKDGSVTHWGKAATIHSA